MRIIAAYDYGAVEVLVGCPAFLWSEGREGFRLEAVKVMDYGGWDERRRDGEGEEGGRSLGEVTCEFQLGSLRIQLEVGRAFVFCLSTCGNSLSDG